MKVSKSILVVIAVILLFTTACKVPIDDSLTTSPPVYYAQCDPAWRYITMNTDTICSTGTVLTSLAMMLTTQDPLVTPAVFDTFLDNNSLYIGDLVSWYSAEAYPSTDFSLIQSGLAFDSLATLKLQLDSRYFVILNVNSGAHWVLVFDYEGDGLDYEDYILHDPGTGGANQRLSVSDSPSQMTTYQPNS